MAWVLRAEIRNLIKRIPKLEPGWFRAEVDEDLAEARKALVEEPAFGSGCH
jgi:hypothetical protein